MSNSCAAIEYLPWLGYFDSLSIAGETVAAASALAGLILVYLGNLHSSFTHLAEDKQRHARTSFRRRARKAFEGVAISLLAAVLGVLGKSVCSELVADASTLALFVAFLWGIRIAWMTRQEVTLANS